MVALTEVDICKMALSRLRVEVSLPALFADFDASSTKAEREILIWYAPVLAEMLEKVSWRPQTIFAALVLLDSASDDTTQPWADKWAYRYIYPADCADLRAVTAVGDGRKLVRQREYDISQATVAVDTLGRVIFSDLNPLNVEYVQSPTDATVYGKQALFCRALSLRLALSIGPGLSASDAILASVKGDYAVALAEAMSKDANEAEEGDDPPSDFFSVRMWG